MEPTVGRIVHYRLTRDNARDANRRKQDGVTHIREHRQRSDGSQIHVGNQHSAGDVVPLLIVRVWEGEYSSDSSVCLDYPAGDSELEWSFPKSHWGVNGQAFLDGNDTLWITSAPEGEFNGAWEWPPRA